MNNASVYDNRDFDQLIGPKCMVGINFDIMTAKLDTEYYGE